jgi:hypothetical protein
MRGSVAKRLRNLAEIATVGKPEVEYGRVMKGKSPTGTVALKDCTRRTYKNLKQLYKAGVLKGVRPQNFDGGVRETV